jgi:transcriptional regulator with XRE-family HTH domain
MQPMVDRLVEIQKREGWPDGRLAREIGISRPAWNLIRRGKRPLRAQPAMQAAHRFPQLTRELLTFVSSATEHGEEAA